MYILHWLHFNCCTGNIILWHSSEGIIRFDVQSCVCIAFVFVFVGNELWNKVIWPGEVMVQPACRETRSMVDPPGPWSQGPHVLLVPGSPCYFGPRVPMFFWSQGPHVLLVSGSPCSFGLRVPGSPCSLGHLLCGLSSYKLYVIQCMFYHFPPL